MLMTITLDESTKWDSIVKSFSKHDVYYLSGYSKAFKIHGDGEPVLFYYKDNDISAINVVMLRDIAEDKSFKDKIKPQCLFDIITPYGYGGFIFEGTPNSWNIENLNKEYSEFCRSKSIICEFVRFHPVLNNSILNSEIYDVSELGKTITMSLDSKEQIWNELSGKNKNVIRKAIRSGVKTYWGRSPELFEKFLPIYNSTMNNAVATEYYFFGNEFYRCVLEDLKFNSMLFYATFNEKIISMSIILFCNDQMHYHLSASDKENRNLAATNLLLYEVACWGCENGYKTFHLGGGIGSKEDNLYSFKKAFSKNSDSYFSIGTKIFNEEKFDELVRIRKNVTGRKENDKFFPTYRK